MTPASHCLPHQIPALQYIVDRVMFGGDMYSAVKQRHGDKINWHFGHALEHVDFERRCAPPALLAAPYDF